MSVTRRVTRSRARSDASRCQNLSSDEQAALAKHITELEGKIVSLDIVGPAGAEVLVDGRTRGRLPLPVPLRVIPGRHVVRLVVDGHRYMDRTIDLAAGQRVVLDAALAPVAPPAPRTPTPAPASRAAADSDAVRWAGWAGVGLGAAGLLTSAVLGGLALGVKGDLEDRCPEPGNCDSEGLTLASRGDTLTSFATGLFIGGAVLAAGGGAVLLLESSDETRSASLRVSPASVAVVGRF